MTNGWVFESQCDSLAHQVNFPAHGHGFVERTGTNGRKDQGESDAKAEKQPEKGNARIS